MKITYFNLHNIYDNQRDIFYVFQALILSLNTLLHNIFLLY